MPRHASRLHYTPPPPPHSLRGRPSTLAVVAQRFGALPHAISSTVRHIFFGLTDAANCATAVYAMNRLLTLQGPGRFACGHGLAPLIGSYASVLGL
jgi:hypothetical protein